MTYEIQDKGTDQLSPKDILMLVQNCHKLPCYHSNSYARKPLQLHKLQILIQLMYDAGLRVNEALNLKVEDVIWQRNIIILRMTKGGWKKCKNAKKYFDEKQFKVKTKCESICNLCNGKGKVRIDQATTVSNEMLELLAQLIEKEDLDMKDYFFESPSFNGQPIRRNWVYVQCKELDKICNLNYYDFIVDSSRVIKGLDTHAFRKSLTKNLVDKIADNKTSLRYAIKQLRHKSDKPLMNYLLPSIESLAKARSNNELSVN